MSTPTPSAIAKRVTLQKQLEQLEVAAKKTEAGPGNISETDSSPLESATSSTPKKPFVPKPHLTQRPLKDNEELKKLRDSLKQNRSQRPRNSKQPAKGRYAKSLPSNNTDASSKQK